MELGQFSVSLAVRDLERSKAFYENLGFEAIGGAAEEKWLILRNGDAVLGLFEGMFDHNILTFNPADVRDVQARLLAAGVEVERQADDGTGPAHATLKDPDCNAILLDQHGDTPE